MMPRLILAPLRGFTDVVYRNAFHHHFPGVGEAVAPFVTSIRGQRIKASHLRDLDPAENRGMAIVPQILSKDPDEFVRLANTLSGMGYREINWNLGCPYPMVAKKMRGSGLLPHPDRIDRMLDGIMSRISGRLSVKTRLGRESTEEMEKLIPVFNRYPISRVIIHPRTGVQMYSGEVDLDSFQHCMQRLFHPLVFNGDINTLPTFRALADRFPSVSGWMLGRGLVSNPFLAEMIHHDTTEVDRSKERFLLFHDALVDGYCRLFSGSGHVLDRMKGFWRYFATGLSQGRRSLKRIRKSGSLDRYRQEVVKALSCQDEWGG